MESHYFQVHNINFHVRTTKEVSRKLIRNNNKIGNEIEGRPVVILVHGLVVASPYMEYLALKLEPYFPVIVPDLPGFGLTKYGDVCSISELANYIECLMTSLGIEKAILIGNSFGCQIIVKLMVDHPDRVSKAVLQGPTIQSEYGTLHQQVIRLAKNGRYEPFSMSAVMLKDYSRAGYSRAYKTVCLALEYKIEEDIPKVNVPTLVMVGELDTVTPVEWCKKIASMLPQGKLIVIPNAAHTLNYSRPEEMAFFVTPFILNQPLPMSFHYKKILLEQDNCLCDIPYIAGFDSSSAMLRSLSHFTHGRDFRALGVPGRYPGGVELFGSLVNSLPKYLKDQVYEWGGWKESITVASLDQLDSEETAEMIVNGYPLKKYPAIMMGSSNGAVTHLCAAMNIPWLPQTYLVPVTRKRSINPNLDFTIEMNWGVQAAKRFLSKNKKIELHQMLDPNQDARMSQHMAYFRFKWRELPNAYKKFIEDTLEPNGVIIIIEDGYSWPCTKAADRHYFQCGAYGGLTPQEYIYGGERVEKYLQQLSPGTTQKDWNAPAPNCTVPESEWGFVASLKEDILSFSKSKGYKVNSFQYTDPAVISPLISDIYKLWYSKDLKYPIDQILVSSFIIMDPYTTIRAKCIPFWSVFPFEKEVDNFKKYVLNSIENNSELISKIFVMMLSHGVESVGVSKIEQWESVMNLATDCGIFLGVDKKSFPKDFGATVNYYLDLQKLPLGYLPTEALSLTKLEEYIKDLNSSKYNVAYVSLN